MSRFNMLSIFLPKQLIDKIATFDFVETIYLDREVRIPELPKGTMFGYESRGPILEMPRIRSVLTPRLGEVDSEWIGTAEAKTFMESHLANQVGITGSGKKIAILDSDIGFRTQEHAQLRGKLEVKALVPGSNIDTCGHGSFVATEILGGKMDFKNVWIEGVAPDARALMVKVLLTPNGVGSTSLIIAGMEAALEWGADVINLSLGSPPAPSPAADPLTDVMNQVPLETIVVCATGNEGGPVYSPASLPQTLAVASLNSRTGETSAFNNLGPELDFLAPGERIFSGLAQQTLLDLMTRFSPGYTILDGTSMGAPFVAGQVLLMQQLYGRDYGQKPTLTTIRDLGAKYGEGKTDARGYGPLKWSMVTRYGEEVLGLA